MTQGRPSGTGLHDAIDQLNYRPDQQLQADPVLPHMCEHINQCYLQVPKLSSKSAVQHSACGENASVEHKEEYLIAGKTRVSK